MPAPTRQTILAAALLCCLIAPSGLLAQKVVADPATLIFSHTVGNALPAPRTVGVGLDTGGVAAYTVEPGGVAWLSVSRTSGQTPGTVTVSVNAIGLSPGIYSSFVRFRSGSSTWTTPVNLFVQELFTDIVVTPWQLNFEAQPGALPPPAQIIQVGAVPERQKKFFVATSGAGWLIANPSSGLTPSSIEVLIDQRKLLPGTYDGAVNLLDEAGRFVWTVPVKLVVSAPSPIVPAPSAAGFQAASGVDAPQSKNVTLTAVGGGTLLFKTQAATESGGNWLSVSPAAGITPMVIAVTVNAAALPVGTYRGAVTLSVLSRAVTIPVTLSVTSGPALVVSPIFMQFDSGAGVAPNPKSLVVDSFSGAPTPFVAAATGGDWLSVSPLSGITLATLTVNARPAGLAPGRYRGNIALTASGSSVPLNVEVNLNVSGTNTLNADVSTLSFVTTEGSSEVVNKSISVTSSGVPLGFTATAASSGWLRVSQSATATPAQVVVSMNPAALAPGSSQGAVTLDAPAAGNSPVTITVTLEVEDSQPKVAAIVHGASLTSGVIAAGTAITLYGSNLGPAVGQGLQIGPDGRVTTSLAGVRILFDGVPGALVYVQHKQANVIVPYGVAGRQLAELVVEYNGLRSRPTQLTLAGASPGIFSTDSTGQGPGAILNQDYSLNSAGNAAAAGDVVIVYGTGAGQTTPPGEDGAIGGSTPALPVLPVRVFIGGVEAVVEYAGSAPGLVAGVLQVNVRIPPSLGPGAYPITIQIGGLRSQPGITVAVK